MNPEANISIATGVQYSVRDFVNSAERDELVKKHGYKTMDYHE